MPAKDKKRRYTKISLAEISGVDVPAQTPAVAEFSKRNDTITQGVAKAALTTAVDGHTHLIADYDGQGALSNGNTTWSGSGGYESQHQHPWIRTEDGIVIGEADGHTHTVAEVSVMKAKQETDMPDEVNKADGDTVEVYKAADGTEYRTAGEIALAKRLDEQLFVKRAGDEFPVIVTKGDDDAGQALAVAVIKSGDEAALKGLQAVETALAETTKAAEIAVGKAVGSTAESDAAEVDYSPFEKQAKEWAAANNVAAINATAEYIKTPEGQAAFAA